MSDTLDQRGSAMPQAFGSSSHLQRKVRQVLNTKVFQFASLEQIPHPFLRIQLWRISRQAFQMNALGTSRAQKVFDDTRAMNGSTIPNDQQFARNLTLKEAQKAHDIWPFVRMVLQPHEHPPIWRQTADSRKVIVGQGNRQNGRLTHWRIRAHSQRQEIKRRLVSKDNGTLFFLRLFFNSVTRCSRHVWIACASCWLARLSGFWTLCLIACR